MSAGYTTVDAIAGMFPAFKRSPQWQPKTFYRAGFTVQDSNGYIESASTPGTSGASAPSWPAVGGTVSEGPSSPQLTWTNTGGTTADQKPSDALITQYALDVQGKIDAVLQKRFQEQITVYGTVAPTNFQSWLATLSTDALDVLEEVNRYGAAIDLGQTLATLGAAAARDLAKVFALRYDDLINELRGLSVGGTPIPGGGLFDHLFDSLARSESVRPGLEGVAGGDQPRGQSLDEEGLSNAFGKFDKRGT